MTDYKSTKTKLVYSKEALELVAQRRRDLFSSSAPVFDLLCICVSAMVSYMFNELVVYLVSLKINYCTCKLTGTSRIRKKMKFF